MAKPTGKPHIDMDNYPLGLPEAASTQSDWEAFQQTEQYQNILRWSDERCNGFTEDDMRQAFQAGERYASEKGAKPPE